MDLVLDSLRNWKQKLLPHFPLMAGRRHPGVQWAVRNGTRVTMRAARASDRETIQTFMRQLSVRSRYYRFFYPLHELPPDLLERFTQADPAREATLLATIEDDGREVVIGMAQYTVTGQDRGEFAVVIADAWQGMGIGKSMLYALSWLARSAGIVWFEGDVLIDNRPMRGLLERTGYTIRSHPDGGNLVRATKRLARPEGKCSRLADFVAQIGVTPPRAIAGYAGVTA